MQETLTPHEQQELISLWCQADRLKPAAMVRAYDLVQRSLRTCHPSEIAALGEPHEELVLQFIYLKVLRLQAGVAADSSAGKQQGRSRSSAPSSSFALCAYFKRYLIDCTRAAAFQRRVSIDSDITQQQFEAQVGSTEGERGPLADHGLDEASVLEAARSFIEGLDEPDRILLREGFGHEPQGGLSAVARKHRVPAYHYRAGRLGLVHRKQDLPSDYARSKIGQWMERELGVQMIPKNMDVVLEIFKILAVQASCS